MPWFKVDDHLPAHKKVLSIPRGSRRLAAIGAWTFGGAWSSANLTEGFIPRSVVDDLGISPAARRDLVTAGLWLAEDAGYRMHDFLEYNPTAAKVKQDRADAAERQRKAREKAKAKRDAEEAAAEGDDLSRRDSRGQSRRESQGQSHLPRPDPTQPVPSRSSCAAERSDGDVKPNRDQGKVHVSTTDSEPTPVGHSILELFGRSA